MITVPAKVKDRIAAGLKRYQPILIKARDKDINESFLLSFVVERESLLLLDFPAITGFFLTFILLVSARFCQS